jgi:branched-chain amino acid transport system permease protein
MSYAIHLLVIIAIYALLASSLNLTAGFMGLVSICQAAFFGVGAYVAALFLRGQNSHAAAVLGVSLLIGWCVGALVAVALFRLKEDYFAIASFAFQAIASASFYNLRPLTGGAPGIGGIATLNFSIVRFTSPWHFAAFLVCVVVILVLVQLALVHSPAGRVLAATREDEVRVMGIGLDPNRYRLALFAAGAAVAALAGTLYASYMTFVDPTPFSVNESILILCCVILGGSGKVAGPILGAAALVCLPEVLRFVGLPSAVAANIRQIVFGLGLIVVIMMRPSGLRGATRS